MDATLVPGGRLPQPESIAKKLFHAVGGVGLVRWRNRDGFRILMYHRFPAERRAEFGRQLDYLHNGYRVLALEEMVRARRSGAGVPANALAITVDDGHRDFYDVAYPELKTRAMSATVFLTTGFLDGNWLWFDRVNWLFRNARVESVEVETPNGARQFQLKSAEDRIGAGETVAESLVMMENEHRNEVIGEFERKLGVTTPARIANEYAPLGWDEVRAMGEHGISFGAHTVTHPTLSALTARERIDEELQESKRRVEAETQREAPVFCYPNGRDADISEQVIASARECGFRAAVQTEPGLNTAATDLFRLRRMAAAPDFEPDYFARVCAVMRR